MIVPQGAKVGHRRGFPSAQPKGWAAFFLAIALIWRDTSGRQVDAEPAGGCLVIVRRLRKSPFVRLFDKTPPEVVCPHFYELILSNGCPYDCSYCYLKLTFRGKVYPTLFTNPWSQVEAELEKCKAGVFSTGELADSLAVPPPLLEPALEYFGGQRDKYLLLLTKSANIKPLRKRSPSPQVIVSFSVNAKQVWAKYERKTPPPEDRLRAAHELRDLGWRIRIRIDPIFADTPLEDYEAVVSAVRRLEPERVTIGTLRQYPGLYRFSKDAPREGLKRSPDGRMRYAPERRREVYEAFADMLGYQPALCKETRAMWKALGWTFSGCNCTP